MEKIFVFIIIMIISSLISKNKKKKAEENFRSTRPVQNKGKSNGYDPKQPSQPVNDLKSLLNSLKNIEQSSIKKTEYHSDSYDDSRYDHESVGEDISYHETEKSSDEINRSKIRGYETSYDELHSSEADTASKEKSRLDKEFYKKHERDTAPKKTVRNKLFETRDKLKDAIIVSEILKRKYT